VGADVGWLKDRVRDIPDFPQAGVVFRDLTPLFADADALATAVNALAEEFADRRVGKVVGIEARGFILAAPVAVRLGAGFIPVRKAGKLPWQTVRASYELEYGVDSLEAHSDAVSGADRVLIIDDVLATGGTAAATVDLVEQLGATVVGLGFVIELAFLGGARKLAGREYHALLSYE
jgi:adenine phosphoribosyltransferase